MVPKPVKRKPEDELPLSIIAVKKAKASSAADGDHGDDDELDYSEAEIPPQNSRRRWLEDSIRLSSGGLSELSRENLVEEVENVEQGDNDTNEEDEMYLEYEEHFNRRTIGIPRESKQVWESNEFFDPSLDIYPLNAAVQLQNDLENLESELVIRDRIPWKSFERELCHRCKARVEKHLLAVLQANRRQPENSVSDERDVETRPSLGTRGGFDYFLGLPTLEELAKKQRDIETLRILRPIRQKFALEKLEPKLCKSCDEYLRKSGKLPEKSMQVPNDENPAPVSGPESQLPVPIGPPKIQPRAPRPAPESVPELGQHRVPIDPPQKVSPKIAPPKQVTTKKAPTPQQFAPDESQPPAQADRPKRKGPAPKLVVLEEPRPAVQAERPRRKGPAPKAVAPEEPQPPAQAEQQKRKRPAPKAVAPEEPQPPAQAERPKRKGPAPKAVAPETPQPSAQAERPKRQGPAPKAVAPEDPQSPVPVPPEEPQPPARAERPKRQGPAPKAVAPEPQPPAPVATEEPQPPVQAERPKRKGPAPKAVAPEAPQPPVQNEIPKRKGPVAKPAAPEEPQPPAPGSKPKKKDPTSGPTAPKEAEPIQPAAAEKPRKKAGGAGKTNILDPPPTSSKPATQEVDKVEDRIEETGPIQQVMRNLPEKPKGHDYYCAICYTNLTRMGSAKKLEHVEKCGTTLADVKVMTKAQAQAEKVAK